MTSYISLDLETTGLSVMNSEIIEIGAWKVENGVSVSKFTSLVRPVLSIPYQVQQLTGITMDDVKDCNPIEEVLVEFFDWCEDFSFLGHNLPFDYNFLLSKGKVLGVDFSLNGTRSGVDTLKQAKAVIKGLESYKLCNLSEYLGVRLTGNSEYHRALYDSLITKLVYERLSYKYQSCGLVMPELLTDNRILYGKAECDDTLSYS